MFAKGESIEYTLSFDSPLASNRIGSLGTVSQSLWKESLVVISKRVKNFGGRRAMRHGLSIRLFKTETQVSIDHLGTEAGFVPASRET